jgi:NitT/TauT family transport system substrate-binding protein
LKTSIDLLVAANGLPRTPTTAEIFDRSYLPAKSELVASFK